MRKNNFLMSLNDKDPEIGNVFKKYKKSLARTQ